MSQTTRARFASLMQSDDDSFSLAEAALLIAAEHYPTLDIPAYLKALDTMAGEASVYVPVRGSARESIAGLNRYLYGDYGLVGNQVEYYDPRNSFLNDVLDRRMGIPITIATLYLEIGWQLGLSVHGIGMPGHFLVGVIEQEQRIVVDAFNVGRACSMDDCEAIMQRIYGQALRFQPTMLQAVTRRDIVIRMLGNLRAIFGQQRNHAESLRWSDLCVIASRESARSLRERGSVRLAMGDPDGARRDLERAIERATDDDERRESELLLHRIPPPEPRA